MALAGTAELGIALIIPEAGDRDAGADVVGALGALEVGGWGAGGTGRGAFVLAGTGDGDALVVAVADEMALAGTAELGIALIIPEAGDRDAGADVVGALGALEVGRQTTEHLLWRLPFHMTFTWAFAGDGFRKATASFVTRPPPRMHVAIFT
jgi:hypothetical protein